MLPAKPAKLLVMSAPGGESSEVQYRAANDDKVANFAGPGRVVGGLVKASGEMSAHKEVVENLFDGDNTTKWLDLEGANPTRNAWVEYRQLPGAPPVTLTRYLLTSGNDHPERDPVEWVLEGLAVGDDTGDTDEQFWMVLDHRNQQKFRKRRYTLEFTVGRKVPCSRFRLRIIRTAHPSAMVQLSCLDLFWNPMENEHVGARLSPYSLYTNDPPMGLTLRIQEKLAKLETWKGSWLDGGHEGGLAQPVPVSEKFPAWTEWVLAESHRPVALRAYSFVLNVDGDAQKAPRSWVLEGQAAGGSPIFTEGSWIVLDRQTDIHISPNDMGHPLYYAVEMPVPCRRFRLIVTAGPTVDSPGVAISRVLFHAHISDEEQKRREDKQRATASTPSATASRRKVDPRQAEWPGVHWRPAQDQNLEEELGLKGRLYGGWCRASDELIEHEEFVQNAFDGVASTKWLDPGGAVPSRPSWLEYRLLPDVPPAVLSHYSITTANDHMERDPQDWTLEGFAEGLEDEEEEEPLGASLPPALAWGALDGGEGSKSGSDSDGSNRKGKWVVLDEQKAVKWTRRFQEESFPVKQAVLCKAFRLCVTATCHPGAYLQLSGLNLFAKPQ